jgi:hypothetical protein
MAKDKLTDYDATASNNTDVGGISVAEGMLPSGVNNAIREQMSHLADFAAGTSGVDVLKLQDDTDTNSIKLQAPASVTANTTFTLPDGDGSADQVLKTNGSGQLGFADRHANPSLIINGAMTVAQRSTSATGVSGYIAVDRFRCTGSADAVDQLSLTHAQVTDAPDGFANSYKITVSTPETTLAADEMIRIEHRMEGQNLQHLKKGTSSAEAVTLSFWIKGSETGTYIINLHDTDNTRTIAASYTINAANTWEYKTITFAGDTTGALDNDNAQSLSVYWYLGAGTNWTSGTLGTSWSAFTKANAAVGHTEILTTSGATWHITGVKLEVGSTATDFVHRSYGEELALCQRYFYSIQGATGQSPEYFGYAYGGTSHVIFVPFLTQMRASPSLSTAGTITGRNSTNTADSSISVEANVSCRDSASIVVRNLTATQGTPSRIELGATGQLKFSAEL